MPGPRVFVVARNPDPGSSLPYLVRLPVGPEGIVLKARDSWPRTAKVYCHQADAWPDEPEVVEAVDVRSCERRGPAIDLVLDRSRENRSQFVFTRIQGGRQAIFWQSARTSRRARPNVGLPTRASLAGPLAILVDTHERYPWRFARQQATTERRPLAAGDYAVEVDGTVVAAVERKSLDDVVSAVTSGRLTFQVAELASVPRAAVVVEDRYSSIFRLDHVRPSLVADLLAELQVRHPAVPLVFAETRPLAEEWTYRFLGAASAHLAMDAAATDLAAQLAPAGGADAEAHPQVLLARHRSTTAARRQAADRVRAASGDGQLPTTAEVRAWATAAGLAVAPRGRLAAATVAAYLAAHPPERDGAAIPPGSSGAAAAPRCT